MAAHAQPFRGNVFISIGFHRAVHVVAGEVERLERGYVVQGRIVVGVKQIDVAAHDIDVVHFRASRASGIVGGNGAHDPDRRDVVALQADELQQRLRREDLAAHLAHHGLDFRVGLDVRPDVARGQDAVGIDAVVDGEFVDEAGQDADHGLGAVAPFVGLRDAVHRRDAGDDGVGVVKHLLIVGDEHAAGQRAGFGLAQAGAVNFRVNRSEQLAVVDADLEGVFFEHHRDVLATDVDGAGGVVHGPAGVRGGKSVLAQIALVGGQQAGGLDAGSQEACRVVGLGAVPADDVVGQRQVDGVGCGCTHAM